MADGSSAGCASSSRDASDVPEETVNINIKTLDSQVFTFRVDKKKPVSLLKENIASAVGVPSGQQRLIFKGKVLKHDHLLSEYNIEDGDTLHLVARQPVQSQSQSGTSSEETRNIGIRGNEATGTIPRARIGHSVVLGLNVSDQGENTAVDLSRIIGSVLNSFGVGTANNTWAAGNASSSSTASQSVGTGAPSTNGSSQTGNQSSQIPSPGTLLRHMVIPDSLTTLTAFISRMEQVLSLHNGYQLSPPSNAQGPTQSVQSPSSSQYPSPDALITVLERAQRLLSGPAAAALSHLLGCLERERGSTELAVRGQIQAEAMHVGVAMQHLGSLLLELGRSVSTLRMGETPAESMVNAGPAVYISASGPNPIMVQPVPHQPGPLFAVPFPPVINVGVPEVGLGDASRNINIHVNAGGNLATAGVNVGSRTNTGEASHEQPSTQGTAFQNPPSHSHLSLAAGGPQSDGHSTVPPLPTGSSAASEMEAEMNPVLTTISHNEQREGLPDLNSQSTGQTPENEVFVNACGSSGGNDSPLLPNSSISMSGEPKPKSHPDSSEAYSTEHAGVSLAKEAASTRTTYHSGSLDRDSGKSVAELSMSSLGSSQSNESTVHVPLGLGLGGLKSKRRTKQSSSQGKKAEPHNESSCSEHQQLIAKGQEVLQSLASQSSKLRPDANGPSAPPVPSSSSSPGSRNSQLVGGQSQNLGGMFSGMLQQMMPVVSQALGADPSKMPTSTNFSSGPQHSTMGSGTSRNNMLDGRNLQIDLQLAVEAVEHEDSPRNIFRNVLEAAGQIHGGSHSDLSEALGNDEELIDDFMEMMRQQLSLRLQSGSSNTDKS